MNVGKAKVKDERENKKTATFADVAGEDEEKEELKEVVEFLKSPEKFNSHTGSTDTDVHLHKIRADRKSVV